jgi:hypothetical protein
MEWKVSFHRLNAFYISLLTMKSSIAFGTVYLFITLMSDTQPEPAWRSGPVYKTRHQNDAALLNAPALQHDQI